MRRLLLAALVLAAALGLPATVHAQPTGRILLLLDAGARLPADVRPTGPAVPEIGLVTVRPDALLDPDGLTALLARLRRAPGVRSAQLEHRFRYRYIPSDPSLQDPDGSGGGLPPGTPLQWPIMRHNLPAAWELARGTDAKVAVIDSGIDVEHPDLKAKLRQLIGDGAGYDEDGHGTHVASLACADTDNGLGIAGTGFGCGLIVVKTDLTDASVAEGLVGAADAGAHAIVMSFGDEGGSRSQAIADALDYARARGAVLVAAAADEPVEEQGEPANLLQPTGSGADATSNLGLVVTAAGFDDKRASFAGRGSQVSLAAYGAGDAESAGLVGAYPANTTERERGTLIPLVPGCNCRTTIRGDNRFAYLAGTSMATPQVAGVAALVASLNPDLRPDEVVGLLKQTARRATPGWEPELGWGIVDAGAAVSAAAAIDRTAPRSLATAPRIVRGRSFTVRWRGRDPAAPGLQASGVARYLLMRSRDGGPYRQVASTTRTSRRLRARSGARDAFITVAIDRAGNREPRPARPDVVVRAR